MTVDYEVTEADLVAFNMHHFRHSRTFQRQLFVARLFLSVITAILTLVSIYFLPRGNEPLNISAYIIAVVAGVFIYLLYPSLTRSSFKKNIEKMLREGKNTGMLGKQRLELTPESLIVTAESGTSTMNWSSIDKIVPIDEYVYIYVNAVSALIVPVKAFVDRASLDAFVQTAQRYQQAHTTTQ